MAGWPKLEVGEEEVGWASGMRKLWKSVGTVRDITPVGAPWFWLTLSAYVGDAHYPLATRGPLGIAGYVVVIVSIPENLKGRPSGKRSRPISTFR